MAFNQCRVPLTHPCGVYQAAHSSDRLAGNRVRRVHRALQDLAWSLDEHRPNGDDNIVPQPLLRVG